MNPGRRPRCLVTRPAHQSAALIERLQQAGFEPLPFPAIAIEAVEPGGLLRQLDRRLAEYDIALFVSRNAVEQAFRHRPPGVWPRQLQLGAIGASTAAALEHQGLASAIIPAAPFNSEALLASPTLQSVAGKRILIFRGQAGRNLLGDTLRDRGARVDYCTVYRRALPDLGPGDYEHLTGGRAPDIALFTSSEGLRNAFSLIDGKQAEALRQQPWLLISDRMRETARDLGHNAAILIADNASDAGILTALERWKAAADPEPGE